MERVVGHELMDDPAVDRAELDRSLRYIRFINRAMGGTGALLSHLVEWSRRWPKDRPVTLLDVGTGSGDIPLAAIAWARSRGFDLHITAIDLHDTTLELARVHTAGETNLTLLKSDALTIESSFGAESFDYVHAGMFLHHLSDAHAEACLRGMGRVARRGIVWNDLHRSRMHHALVNLLLVGQPWIVRHDARASVAAGFTRRDAEDLAQRAGLTFATYRRGIAWYRFTVAGEKEAATATTDRGTQ